MSITIQFLNLKTNKVQEKTFPSHEALDKWLEFADVRVLRYLS